MAAFARRLPSLAHPALDPSCGAVLFAELSKFDGAGFRYLSSGEYIQMSGRAGRRGLDTRGVVVQMVDEKTDAAKVREMMRPPLSTIPWCHVASSAPLC